MMPKKPVLNCQLLAAWVPTAPANILEYGILLPMINASVEINTVLSPTVDLILKAAPELQKLTKLLPPSVADALIFVVPKIRQYELVAKDKPLDKIVNSSAILVYLETAMDLQHSGFLKMAKNRLLSRNNQGYLEPIATMTSEALRLLNSDPQEMYLALRTAESTLIDLVVGHHLITTTIGEALKDTAAHKQYALPLLEDIKSVRNACEALVEQKMVSPEQAAQLTNQALTPTVS